MVKEIAIYSGHALDNAYSCILYLKNALEKDYSVVLWSNSQKNNFGDNSYLFENTWYYKIPKIRFLLKNIHVFFNMVFHDSFVIINDLDFFIVAYYAKKIKKSLKVIHYNTEIHGVDVKYFSFIEKFYEKHANFPDLIIDCLEERATYRKNKFNIDKEIYVINNTCSKEYIDSVINENFDKSNFSLVGDRKVLIYSGSCEYGVDLDKLVNIISSLGDKVYFLCYCYGKEESFNALCNKCKSTLQEGTYQINKSIDRSLLLNILYHVGDIGIVYYDPSKSINYKYASPSKFFEYMACGLNILSTNNEGINRIISSNNLGKCFINENDIYDSLQYILNEKLMLKKDIINLFNTKYCYENDSIECINAIKRLIENNN